VKRTLIVVGVCAVAVLALRVYTTRRGLPLHRWHTYVPHELDAAELDGADWQTYMEAENALFDRVRLEVSERLPPDDRVPVNRYFEGSPVYPAHFAHDWNRSYVLEPDRRPVGAVVLLHGLTDAPYSQRHIAQAYRDRGFVAVVIRLPAHGTVPGALTDVTWDDWAAATRLAVREARRHLVGYSNGGALALKYALDAIGDETLARPARVVLISPMVGITRFARFAGLAGLPAVLPAFAESAWLSVLPEFNPFKYNSFPVNAARQSYRLTAALQEQVARDARTGQLAALPPILTFQSVMDFTVSTAAIVSALYAHLPANGSELVLFDVNRTVKFGPLLRPTVDTTLTRILPPGARAYRTTIVTNASDDDADTIERTTAPGAVTEQTRRLGIAYPAEMYSLSHIALPFPLSDALYGLHPDPGERYGISLGTLAPRGERNVLVMSLDALLRATSNPFFPYLIEKMFPTGGPGTTAAPRAY
jgi:alpha-beta hydrolase superfamily lysophospholipase